MRRRPGEPGRKRERRPPAGGRGGPGGGRSRVRGRAAPRRRGRGGGGGDPARSGIFRRGGSGEVGRARERGGKRGRVLTMAAGGRQASPSQDESAEPRPHCALSGVAAAAVAAPGVPLPMAAAAGPAPVTAAKAPLTRAPRERAREGGREGARAARARGGGGGARTSGHSAAPGAGPGRDVIRAGWGGVGSAKWRRGPCGVFRGGGDFFCVRCWHCRCNSNLETSELLNRWTASPSAKSRRLLNTSGVGDSTTSLSSPVQCMTTRPVEKPFFLLFNPNLPCRSLRPFSQVLSLQAKLPQATPHK